MRNDNRARRWLVDQVEELGNALPPALSEELAEMLQGFDKVPTGKVLSFAPFGPGPRAGGPQGGPPQGDRGGGPPFGPPGGIGRAAIPIKGFVVARWRAIDGQLVGKSKGMSPSQGFGPPIGGPGGPGLSFPQDTL